MEGILVVNKPVGITSHDVVHRVRRTFGMKRVGHAGTLDPLATGVLVVLLGRSTKLFKRFESFDKGYRATLILGQKTTSADIQGKILEERPWQDITREQIEEVFKEFNGTIEQKPPMVSAVKINGERLYKLARKGVVIDRPSRTVTIRSLKLEAFEPPRVTFSLECSKGTYVRKLAEDVGDRLGCGACIAEIQRTRVGPFRFDEAVTLDQVREDDVRPWRD